MERRHFTLGKNGDIRSGQASKYHQGNAITMNTQHPMTSYSIRGILGLIFVACILCAMARNRVHDARLREIAADELRRHGARLYYDFEFSVQGKKIKGARSPYPEWLVTRVGLEFLHHVVSVDLTKTTASNEMLAAISKFTQLESLYAASGTVDDDGLRHLGQLTELKKLILPNQHIRGPGLAHLASLGKLETLAINDQATNTMRDQDLAALARLSRLKHLNLMNNTTLSPACLKHLSDLDQLESLELPATAESPRLSESERKTKRIAIIQLPYPEYR